MNESEAFHISKFYNRTYSHNTHTKSYQIKKKQVQTNFAYLKAEIPALIWPVAHCKLFLNILTTTNFLFRWEKLSLFDYSFIMWAFDDWCENLAPRFNFPLLSESDSKKLDFWKLFPVIQSMFLSIFSSVALPSYLMICHNYLEFELVLSRYVDKIKKIKKK